MKKATNFLGVLFILFTLISCNTTTKKEMDHFVTGKVQTIDKSEDGYGIILKTLNDTIIGLGYTEDMKEYTNQLSTLQVGQEISIKGVRTCFSSWKRKESPCHILIKKIKF